MEKQIENKATKNNTSTKEKVNKGIMRKIQKFDATDMTVGRLATKLAIALRGKDKPEFLPYIDSGDLVEVTNIKKLRFTGKKLAQKEYYSYSGYPGGLKTRKIANILAKDPGEVLRRAVREMLPPTRLRTAQMKRLTIK
jgi:large subunit ribosomal protein L13